MFCSLLDRKPPFPDAVVFRIFRTFVWNDLKLVGVAVGSATRKLRV
ncbi:hypothetical protein [Rubritalea tangerina]